MGDSQWYDCRRYSKRAELLTRPPEGADPFRDGGGASPLVLVRVVDVASSHRHAQRTQRVLDADRAGVRVEDVRKSLVDLRCLVGSATDQDDPLLTQTGTHGVPVHDAGADELLGAQLAHLGAR